MRALLLLFHARPLPTSRAPAPRRREIELTERRARGPRGPAGVGLPLFLAVLIVSTTVPAHAAYLGIASSAVRISGDDQPLRYGIRVDAVMPGSPAERAGLLAGDVLIALDGQRFQGDDTAAILARFRDQLAKASAGEPALLSVARTNGSERVLDPASTLVRAASVEIRVVLADAPEDRWRPLPSTEPLLAGATFDPHPIAGELEGWLSEGDLQDATSDLYQRLRRLAERGDGARSWVLTVIQRSPYLLPPLLDSLSDGFRKRPSGGAQAAVDRERTADAAVALREALDATAPLIAGTLATRFDSDMGAPPEPPAAGSPAAAHLHWIEILLLAASQQRLVALAELDTAEVARIQADWQRIGERFENELDLDVDPDRERAAANLATIASGEKIDRERMVEAARILSPLVSASYIESLARDLEAEGFDLEQEVVLTESTPYGPIVISGRGSSRHVSPDPAVLIDLGGDDFYGSVAGATRGILVGDDERDGTLGLSPGDPDPAAEPRRRGLQGAASISVVVDLAGNDVYESSEQGAQGCGVLGVGLLADLGGDDSYLGGRWAQGCGFLGVGVLIDVAGDDRYRAHAFAQGIGFFGAGLLIDLAGNDRYDSTNLSQAVGMPGGAGVLVDRAGNDEYFSKGSRPTSYDQPGLFDSFSQGCGVGFRRVASGGIALLIDEDGSDRYEAGAFSQGGGYSYGVGALIDGGAVNDRYIGSRYSQGFAAHQSAGYFVEEGGDDRYETRFGVMAGLAWDQSIAFFVERGGDDRYQGGSFSLGASAHNSIAIFLEQGGDDQYPASPLGASGPNAYHGGSSLSLFLDEGAGEDRYRGSDLANSAFHAASSSSLLVDR